MLVEQVLPVLCRGHHQLSGRVASRVAEVVMDGLDRSGYRVGGVSPGLLGLGGAISRLEGLVWVVADRVLEGVLDVGPVLA